MVVAHLAELAGTPSLCTRVVTTVAAGAAARVPRVDGWPRIAAAAAAAQALGGLGECVGRRFEDGDSPGRCGGGGLK
jgi:hypothetical protein